MSFEVFVFTICLRATSPAIAQHLHPNLRIFHSTNFVIPRESAAALGGQRLPAPGEYMPELLRGGLSQLPNNAFREESFYRHTNSLGR